MMAPLGSILLMLTSTVYMNTVLAGGFFLQVPPILPSSRIRLAPR